MPTYLYFCSECNEEFEEMHSITIVLEHCPKCKENGKETKVKRLIASATPGTMELTGYELSDKVKADVKQLKKDMSKSENLYANMLGHDKYQQMQQKIDYRKRNKY